MARGYFSSPITLVADFGAGQTGLSTVGYAIKNGDGSTFQARTTTGVSEVGAGIYKVRPGASVFTDTFDGYVVWDTGGGSPKYASEELQMVAAPPNGSDYTSARAVKLDDLDATISSRSSHNAADVAVAVWAAATRTLTAISDSSGITTLLSRLTSGRATNLDHLDADVSTRATPADVDVQIESDAALIADAVWDELLADHEIEGSAGDALERPISPPTLISAAGE